MLEIKVNALCHTILSSGDMLVCESSPIPMLIESYNYTTDMHDELKISFLTDASKNFGSWI